MRICVYGAGAIGGLLAARIAAAGQEVSVIARGPHLAAIRAHGLTLESADGLLVTHPVATDEPRELPPQDYVLVCLKAHSVAASAAGIAGLCGADAAVVMAVNGVPWWYFHALPGRYAGTRLTSVDPGHRQWDLIRPERVIGAVVYPACEIVAPGVVRHLDGDRFSLGEPDGRKSERVQRLAEALRAAGFKAPVRAAIRDELWVKLWGNLSFNPISALTGATLETIRRNPATRAVARAMMVEAEAIGRALGVSFPVDVDQRIEGAAAVGAHKTSMLQDLERGRALEIDALVTAVQELGRLTGVATPTIDSVLGLVQLRGAVAGCYTLPSGDSSTT